MCLVRPSCDLPLCSCLGIFVNVPRRLPGRIFVKEFGLDLAVSGKVSCGLLAFVLVLCVRTCRPWIFLGRSRRRIFVVWIDDDDTGEGVVPSGLPMAIRTRGDEDETPLPVTVASHGGRRAAAGDGGVTPRTGRRCR